MTPFYEQYGKNPKHELWLFFSITFAITWGIAIAYFIEPSIAELVGGPPGADVYHNWLYYTAVYAPLIATVILIAARDGWSGFRQLGSAVLKPGGLFRWFLWLLVAFSLFPVGWVTCAFLADVLGIEGVGDADASILFVSLPITLIATTYLLYDPGPVGEEIGWRGYAMPRLLRLMTPFASGVVLGVIWAVWHIPAFLISASSQAELSFLQFLISLTSQGVIYCWLYLRTQGNWFFAGVVPHAVINGGANLGGFTVDAWIYALVPLITAILIVLADPRMRPGYPGSSAPNFVPQGPAGAA